MSNDKYTIIGQGLAGTILAFHLEQIGLDFKIIDDAPKRTSSRVAAGLYNPVVFKRLTHSWRANELMPYLDEFYSWWENKFNFKIHTKRPILKVLANDDEKDFWISKSQEDHLKAYISPDIINKFHSNYFDNHSGLGKVLISGNVDTNNFLDISRDYFIKQGKLESRKFTHNEVENNSHFIFSEGWTAIKSPFFSYLPFNLAKGETFVIKVDGLAINEVVNKRVFLLPLGNNIYKVGSTYKWDFEDDLPTNEEAAFLKDKLDVILKAKYEIIEHDAGIRPATKDRRPFVGTHPENQNIHIFNGMGSKGVMIAPLLAKEFSNYLIGESDLNLESDIRRFD